MAPRKLLESISRNTLVPSDCPAPCTLYPVLCTLVLLGLSGCIPNNPYPASEAGANIYYSTFAESPKHLDPAISYSSDEYSILNLVYEPPLQYHYLKRPYQLVPAAAAAMPREEAYDRAGSLVPADAPPGPVEKTVYTITIARGIRYHPHPCFARDEAGVLKYRDLPPEMPGVDGIEDFPDTGTRELTAADYVNQIKRLADPTLAPGCPILPIMAKYILGLEEYARLLRADLQAERTRRREAAGAFYSRERDEIARPIRLDLDRHRLPGAVVVDRYTYRVTIRGRYPQVLYWLAMPFFSPVPAEALDFYAQGALARKNITLNRCPVGTGPFRIRTYNPNREIVLERNEGFRAETYPSAGEPSDRARGLFADAGKRVPFIDRVVLKLEKEAIPRWTKFLQGYFDSSGIPSESFDQAVQFSQEGTAEVSEDFQARNLRLEIEVAPVTYYFAFNMLDPVVGGYSARPAKLRRAIAIAIDTEERIQIFYNGRGMAAHGILPPGIFGHEAGREGIDPYVYVWDAKTGSPVRRGVEEARRLLAEAGYPGGKDAQGRQLVLRFANPWTNPESQPLIKWLTMKLSDIGIELANETTDYNRFQEKAHQGNFQILHWGWHADYPDPENFLFLLYGANGKVKHHGENVCNYENPEFDRVFRRLETMRNSPARLELIRKANRILQRDAPMVWGFHPVTFGLYHGWLRNTKPHAIAYGSMKYLRLDPAARHEYRRARNRPLVWPVALAFLLFAGATVPAFLSLRRRARREA